MKPRLKAFLLLIIWLYGATLWARPVPNEGEKPAEPAATFLGITILGSPNLRFVTVDDYQNGVTLDHSTVQLAISLGTNWSLQVRATDDLRYQNQSIAMSNISLQSLSTGSKGEVVLKSSDQVLASGVGLSVLNLIMSIRYRAKGGASVLKPAGTYNTTLVFTYTAL